MSAPARAALALAAPAFLAVALLAWAPEARPATEGFRVDNETLVARCSRCHAVDDSGRMGRISYMRKTPEGWQTSVRRMVSLHGVRLSAEHAREIVRYLSDHQGLAPEELEPGLYEVERRSDDQDYDGDDDVERTCIRCHSMGRVITQRRTKEEWGLLLATHRALYPLVDFQAFRRPGPPPREPGPDGRPPDPRHPMDKAIDHLSSAFPLETPAWSAWSANMRAPRLAGTWMLTGHEPGRGPVYGTVTIAADGSDPAAFTTDERLVWAESGQEVTRSGQALVYTGYQWRGRSSPGADDELREVMTVARDQQSMEGRWFRGAYDELGPDVTLLRVGGGAVIAGVHPRAAERGGTVDVRIYGAGLPSSVTARDLDFGPGVRVASASARGGIVSARLEIDEDAAVGVRDLFAFGASVQKALAVHDGIDRLEVTPATGMARVGGAAFPKQLQVFDAVSWDDGPDGEPGNEDDVRLGRVPVTWSLEEYAATFGDDDIDFVGAMGQDGTFTPDVDGPNPERSGNRNNVGDVWVVATYGSGEGALRARAHLLVTVPLYMRWEPWREIER
ncbi:MAG TPA: quinohemoprotein amine dehydrogenase subunit alpha [Longimicrobiales bacterium]|nr:quinohemoprotein amine dehydrogenase subunit alpha [Longimicrobiales bacterium]